MAGSSGAIRAGAAYVEIFANDSKFMQSMTKMRTTMASVGKSITKGGTAGLAVGTGVVGSILASAQAFANVGSALNDMSARTGVATEALSVLKFAAEQTGTDMAGVETGIKKMQKAIFAAANGSDEAAKALGAVGLSAQQLQGLSADQQIGMIADGLLKIDDDGTRAAVAMQIFGKAGTSMLPMLAGGSTGMAAFAAEAKRLGLVMDQDTAAKADTLGDAIDALKAAVSAAFIKIGAAAAPVLTKLAGDLSSAAAGMGQFVSQNSGLVVGVLKAAAVLTAFSAVAVTVGTALSALSTIIGTTQAALLLLSTNPAVLGGLAVAVVAIGGIGLALRALWPDFKNTTDEYLKMIGVISGGAADRGGKPLEARDIAPKLGAEGQARLQGIVDQKKTAIGADLNVPAAMRRVVLDEADKVKNNDLLPKAERDRRVFELMQIAAELQSQMDSEAAAAKSAKEAAAAAEKTAAAAKERAESGRQLTDEQQKEVDRIREENKTPQQKLEEEKARLMSLTSDTGNGLSQEEVDAAVKRAEEQAQQEIDAANKKGNEERDRLTEQAQAVREQVATPEEKLAARIDELKKLPLDAETMARAVDQAKADAVDSLTAQAQGDRQGISSAGTFGDATMLGIGPELSDPMAQTAENTRRMVDELAALNLANGGPANVVGPPVANLAGPIGAEVAAPRAADLQQKIAGGAEAATATATLTASVQTMQQQMVAAIDRTTAAVESTVQVLKDIASNTADMGAVFV